MKQCSLFIFIGLVLLAVLPAQAQRIPLGTVVLIERLGDESSDTHFDLYSSILMPGMSKAIAQQGLSQGFFVVETKDGTVSGFDLRPIMLYHIGLVKTPIKMLAPRRNKSSEAGPMIALPSLPESPVNTLASPATPVLSPKINVLPGTGGTTTAGSEDEAAKGEVNIDLKRLQAELLKAGDGPQISLLRAGLSAPDISQRPGASPAAEHYKFRFFTYRMTVPVTPGYINALEKNVERYNGSFVVASPFAIRSINRSGDSSSFSIRQGRILVGGSPQATEVIFDQAKVHIPPQAVVAIEADEKKGLAVLVLDCPDNAAVSLAPPSGPACSLKRLETVDLLLPEPPSGAGGESNSGKGSPAVVKMTAKAALERSWVYRGPHIPQIPTLARLLDDLRKQILGKGEGKAQSLP